MDVAADMQQSIPNRGKTIFLGDVTVTGVLDTVKVNLRVNGLPAAPGFQPSLLNRGAIQRLEVTDRSVTADGKMTVNVVLSDPAR